MAMGIQDQSTPYTCEKYNETHKFVKLINGNKNEEVQ